MPNEPNWTTADLINPDHTALLVIDMQNDYCSRKGVLARMGFDMGAITDMAPRLARLISLARKFGLTIIHTRNIHSNLTDTPPWKRRAKNNTSLLHVARKGTWGAEWFEDYREFIPLEEEHVVTKHRYSAFFGTDLDIVLKSCKIRTTVIAGTATNGCVESTARDALLFDYNVVLTKDCTAAYSRQLQEATEINISMSYGDLMSSEAIVSVWEDETRRNIL